MKCRWCEFEILENENTFSEDVYYIFDVHNKILNHDFCSLNCGLSFIYREDIDVDERIKLLYDNYNINSFIFEAKDKSVLCNFGGNLSYEEYRKDFVCPNVKKSFKNKALSYEKVVDEYKISKYSSDTNRENKNNYIYSEENINNFDY
jgi:hypothetical protein